MRSYIKLDASFFRHPKAVAAGRDARDLFIAGLCYSGDLLTDGFVPCGAIAVLAAEAGIRNHQAATQSLVAVGLWESENGGYRAHDWPDYNTTSDTVNAKREAAKERMKRIRSEDVRENIREHPEDVREQEKEKEKERSYEPNGSSERTPPSPKDDSDFESFWKAYPVKKAKADALRAWRKLKAGKGPRDRPPIDELLAVIARQRLSPAWLKDDGGFIPHASTWLNGRRWEDEVVTSLNGAIDWKTATPEQVEAYRQHVERENLRHIHG